MIDVNRMLMALRCQEQEYLIELGEPVITEIRLDLDCENDERAELAARIIQESADTGQAEAGWVYISHVERALAIGIKAAAKEK